MRSKLRRELLYLKDAIVHTERVLLYSRNITVDQLAADQMRLDAILRNLQLVGESVKQLPPSMRELRPSIPWTKIAGIRNRLVHHYFGVDTEVVFDICTNHAEPLLQALKEIAKMFPELAVE